MKSHLLNDEAILHFIARGYCVVKTSVAPHIHAQILTDAKKAMAERNLGNDILYAAPGLREIFDDEAMVGALSSILGDSYVMHCHRHCHRNTRGHRRPKIFIRTDQRVASLAGADRGGGTIAREQSWQFVIHTRRRLKWVPRASFPERSITARNHKMSSITNSPSRLSIPAMYCSYTLIYFIAYPATRATAIGT